MVAAAVAWALLLVVALVWWWWVRSRPAAPLRGLDAVAVVTKRLRVAVIGGGIAGCGAAWSLQRSDVHVTLFERTHTLGGNAKTHAWPSGVRSGLAVLAWPADYFRHYEALLSSFALPRQEVSLPFLVECVGPASYVALSHTDVSTVDARHAGDLRRWQRMVAALAWVNTRLLAPWTGGRASLYGMTLLNPLNVLPLRWVAALFGVTASFWHAVVVPVYSSTFLTRSLNWVPAVIAPIIAHIVPLDRVPRLTTWSRDSGEVFARLTQDVAVRLSASVVAVTCEGGKCTLVMADGERCDFDRVLFACPPDAALAMLRNGGTPSWWTRLLLGSVSYVDDDVDGASFVTGVVHSAATAVLSTPAASRCLSTHSNYVAVHEDGSLSNTFVLSSWVPPAQSLHRNTTPMLVTYGPDASRVSTSATPVEFSRAHPHLCLRNLLIARLLRTIQGRQGLFFASSWTTPGNGHDLSLCSGLAAAYAIGAAYPFGEDKQCAADFAEVRSLLGL